MKKSDIKAATNEDLISQFKRGAATYGVRRTAREANRAFDECVAIWRELKQRGNGAVGLFLELLNSPDPNVRLLSAGKALFVAPELAEPVLDALKSEPPFVGFTASFTLQQWRAGKLKPLV